MFHNRYVIRKESQTKYVGTVAVVPLGELCESQPDKIGYNTYKMRSVYNELWALSIVRFCVHRQTLRKLWLQETYREMYLSTEMNENLSLLLVKVALCCLFCSFLYCVRNPSCVHVLFIKAYCLCAWMRARVGLSRDLRRNSFFCCTLWSAFTS